MGTEHPSGTLNVTTDGIDENLVLVELENKVRQPPALLALHALSVLTMRAAKGLCEGGGVRVVLCQSSCHSRWCLHTGRQIQATSINDTDGQETGAWDRCAIGRGQKVGRGRRCTCVGTRVAGCGCRRAVERCARAKVCTFFEFCQAGDKEDQKSARSAEVDSA